MNYILILSLFLFSCAHHQKASVVSRYNRKDWKHWTDNDKNCLNTRQELLKQRSLVKVTMNKKGCTVVFGKWNDYYYPEVLVKASSVDVDHVIPLKHAHDSGGAGWAPERKEHFANDPDNLVLTNKKYNRRKGAKTIAEWLPVNAEYACKYVTNWFRLKQKYHLEISREEMKTKSQLKDQCTNM